MRYQRTPPQKSFMAYLVPFLILIILGLIVFLLVRFWDNIGNRASSETSYAYMQTIEGDAKVMLWGATDWTSVPKSTIKLFKGDSIRALPGSRVKISLFEKHHITLNGDSEMVISELRKENQTLHTSLTLNRGEAWLDVDRDINPNSTFLIKTDSFQAETKGAILDVEPDILRVVKGGVAVDVYSEDKVVTSTNVGVGQEIVLSDAKMQSLTEGAADVELVAMLSDEFKLSNWYLFNTEGKNIGVNNTGGTTVQEGMEADYLEETDGIVKVSKPVITSPAGDGEEFKITGTSQRIEGTVKAGTAKVIVNNYTLQSFAEGDTEWKYNADIRYGNLEEGKNKYEVFAEDAEGKRSQAAVITLIYGDVKEEEGETPIAEEEGEDLTAESEEGEATEPVKVTGELKIVEPNEGEDFTTTETRFVLNGTAPSNAAKIIVSGYTLQGFKAGDETWKYTADPQYNNITVGEDNTYKVVAYDEDDKIIATEELVITVEKKNQVETGTGETAD